MKEFAKKEIEKNSLDILHFLDLGIKKYNTPISKQLEMVLKLYKYVVQNIRSQNSASQNVSSIFQSEEPVTQTDLEKKQFEFEKLRQALTCNPGDTASNVILFNYLLYLKGFKSCIVLSESNNRKGEAHLSNLVELGKDNWYFFDPSLERINFIEDQYGNPEDFSYNWAGLGKRNYSKFYRPVVAIRAVGAPEVPVSSYNISEEPILREFVESVGKGIPDLTYSIKKDVPKREVQDSQEVDDKESEKE